VRRGREVSLPLLAAGAGGKLVQLHVDLEHRCRGLAGGTRRWRPPDCSLGLTGPPRDRPRPRGALDKDILSSGTTGQGRRSQCGEQDFNLVRKKISAFRSVTQYSEMVPW
jgi:hypothetical protein